MNTVQPGQPKQSPDQELCTIAQEFMTRTELKGREVDPYARAFNFLNEIVAGNIVAIPAEAWAEAQTELQKYKDEFGDLPVIEDEPPTATPEELDLVL